MMSNIFIFLSIFIVIWWLYLTSFEFGESGIYPAQSVVLYYNWLNVYVERQRKKQYYLWFKRIEQSVASTRSR